MGWSIHRVSLATHSLEAASGFFGTLLGLGPARRVDAHTLRFGSGSRGLQLVQPGPLLQRGPGGALLGQAGARHLALEVDDLGGIAARLARAGLPCVEALPGEFGAPALLTLDPALNLVAFCQRDAAAAQEAPRGWELHHVNLPAAEVRATVAFYRDIAGLEEGRWEAPPRRGSFSTDPAELAMLPDGRGPNRGLHLIRPDSGFALRNGFAHNPSIGGHPAILVPDLRAVAARLEAAGIPVSDAGVYAMAGMHQIYLHDPSANVIEVNQAV